MNRPALRIVPQPDRYEIDRGIPIPSRYTRGKYPWNEMKVGDSFFVEGDKRTTDAARAAVRHRRLKTGEKYTVRKKPNGLRVWRVL